MNNVHCLIGILTLNNPTRLRSCLEAIYATHDMYKSEYDADGKELRMRRGDITVIALDDCSTEDNLANNKKICAEFGIDLLMHNTRQGIPSGWNDLTKHHQTEYCILLNDDVLVVHNWLDCIIYTLKHNPQIGVVGLNAYEGIYSELPSNNVPTYIESKILLGSRIMPILSARGFAFGFRKDDYLAVGGFDKRFFCFFEEIDFNLSIMTMLGKRNCILSHPIIKHTHGDTILKFNNHTDIFNESKKKFEDKWQIKWSDLRVLFNYNNIPKITLELNEWNSNIAIWG